jgi:hypothetical protein
LTIREEYAGLEAYCVAKRIRIQDEMTDDGPAYDQGSDISEISRDDEDERMPQSSRPLLGTNLEDSESGILN